VVALPLAEACRPAQTAVTAEAGDRRELPPDPPEVAPEHQETWERLARATEESPTSDAVVDAADELLKADPPGPLRARALFALARRAYLLGEDPAAASLARRGLSAEGVTEGVRRALQVLEARAEVRGGDPAVALPLAETVAGLAGLPDALGPGLVAVAQEGAGHGADAARAHARWRAASAPDSAESAYSVARFTTLAAALDPADLLAQLGDGATNDCLRRQHGAGRVAGAPPCHRTPIKGGLAEECLRIRVTGTVPPDAGWAAGCLERPRRIGVMLPRTGRLSALADVQLGAAQAAVLALSHESFRLLWADSGVAPGAAATDLVRRGAEVLVGPMGRADIRAARAATPGVPTVVPSESMAGATGVAPSLEARVSALVDHAKGGGIRRVAVVAPSNGYGARAVKALKVKLQSSSVKLLILHRYSTRTTSFAEAVTAIDRGTAPGAAVIVLDQIGRTDLFLRQLARAGHPPSEATVYATGEGIDPARIRRGFEGVWVVPAAAPSERDAPFITAYRDLHGAVPGDQALLVWRAVSAAVQGTPEKRAAHVVRIRGGRLGP